VARATKKSRPVAAARKTAPAAKKTSRAAGAKTARPPKGKEAALRRAKPVAKAKAKPAAPGKAAKPTAKKAPPARGSSPTATKSKEATTAAPASAPKPAAKPVLQAVPEPPKKPRKPELSPKEIAAVKASLLEQRKIFSREFEDIEEGAFNISQSEMSGEVSFDEEYADAGSATFEREKELSITNNIRDLLDKVDHALNAIEKGTYGICENCGNPIAKARLLALPYSTMCLRCKQQEERTR
jgi:DnaK suppressor protein